MIEVKNLQKEFNFSKEKSKPKEIQGKIKVIDNISFVCNPGKVFCLLGPNGAGKSTTLRIIATILKPTLGEVFIAGLNVNTHLKEVRKRIGFLTATTGLYENLTPNELLKYFGDLYGIEEKIFNARKLELYEIMDVEQYANKLISKLSVGTKQKISLCRTMIHDPDILIFDEPTSGLDIISSENVLNLINTSRTRGKTILFSSHIMSEVELLADDLAILNKGNLLYNGSMREFKNGMQSENLTQEFIRIVKQK